MNLNNRILYLCLECIIEHYGSSNQNDFNGVTEWRNVDISKFCAKVPTFSTFMLGVLISMTEIAIL